MSLTIEKQRYSGRFPYDNGFAIIDDSGQQTGWYHDRDRAKERISEANETPATGDHLSKDAAKLAVSR